jgi:hypothetical protein
MLLATLSVLGTNVTCDVTDNSLCLVYKLLVLLETLSVRYRSYL